MKEKDEVLTIAQIKEQYKDVFSIATLDRRQQEGIIEPCAYSKGKTGKRYFRRSAIERMLGLANRESFS